MSKFRLCDKSRDMSVCAYNIDRIFLRSTLKAIQLSVLLHIFTAFELIITINIKILILIFIVLIIRLCENLFILKISNKIKSLNDLIKRFLILLTLLLKISILIKNIN